MAGKRTSEGLRIAGEFDKGYKSAGRDFQPPAGSVSDLNEVISLGLEGIQRTRGAQAKYPATQKGAEEFYKMAINYFRRINEVNESKDPQCRSVLPDFEGLALFCGITRATLYSYGERAGVWQEMINLFRELIVAAKKQSVSSFQMPPVWAMFDLTNNANYRNTNTFIVDTQESRQRQQDTKTEAQLDAAGLVWSEELGEYIPETESEVE